MKKILALILALALVSSVAVFSLAEEGTEYTFEAEYTYLEDLEGLGVSGSPTGIGLASESSKASNDFFVGNLGVNSPITFKITSDAAATATLKIRVGTNVLGTVSWDPVSFIVTVNGEPLEYEEFTTEPGDDPTDQQNFKVKTLGEIELVEGENIIVFVAGENTYRSNLPSAPSIDYIRLTTTANLTMEEYPENIE
ncbi:MAG: hypothetical protein IJ229_01350 [Clostridia bacterium]|nr:hypothetical protein [Clostridia bacterium]MBR1684773.1 hypothetical protein [Clostridia bacterium]MBR2287958.1 hypothetical protein [Clostridia bacterium]